MAPSLRGGRHATKSTFVNFESHSSDSASHDGVVLTGPQARAIPARAAPDIRPRFTFIDNTNTTPGSGTEVRKHVMREFMRQKRWKDRRRLDTSPSGNVTPAPDPQAQKVPPKRRNNERTRSPSPASPSPTKASPSESRDRPPKRRRVRIRSIDGSDGIVEEIERLQGSKTPLESVEFFFVGPASFASLADMTPESSREPSSSLSRCDSFSSLGTPEHLGSLEDLSPEPQSLLSAARSDPFDCLPMTLSLQDQELFDFYARVMPACSYGFERRSPRAHNWYLSVFIPEAMKGAVCFQNTILVHSANTQAWVKGLTETPLSIEHRARASKMLLEHFQKSPTDTSDASISATLSAAALEDFDPRVERKEYAWVHWRAAVQKIRDRGGPAALIQHNRLQTLINWSDYIFSGYNAYGATFFFDHESSPVASNAYQAEMIARREIAQQCEEFIKFLRCVEHLALVQGNLHTSLAARQRQPLRYSVFQVDQPMGRLLARADGARFTKTGQFKQIISRLAALLTINTAIWEYRHSTDMSEEFLRELLENIEYNELDAHLSVEALIQILLSGSSNPALLDSERPWLVGRMLKVAKRLNQASFVRLNDILLQFLTLGPELRPVMLGWENELRMEILQAPLVSYVMPAMQSEQ